VESNPALVKKVMRAWFKAIKYYRLHPDEASTVIAKYYKITPEEYRRQAEGLKWVSYEEQVKQLEYEEWIHAFNTIADIKLAQGKISQKPDASKSLNHTLLEKLYEDSK
jgi:NitT/TauT family transport system substrate-binding protein